jgi:predicted Zn finger-like uncharacterized protein
MIRFRCPHCQATLSIPDHKAGAAGKCPRCKSRVQVPAGSASAISRAKSAPPAPAFHSQQHSYYLRSYLLLAGVVGVLALVVFGFFQVRRLAEPESTGQAPADIVQGSPPATTPAPPPTTPAPQTDEVSQLIQRLKGQDLADRMHAARALAKLGPKAAPAVPELIAALRDQTDHPVSVLLRQAAAGALAEIGPEAAPAVPALRDALRDKNREVQQQAIDALVKIGKPSLNVLTEALQHPEMGVRVKAAAGIAALGPEAKDAVPKLVQAAMTDAQAEAQVRIAASLMRVDPDNQELVLIFIRGLKHPTDEIRKLAAVSLGQLGARAKLAIPDLTDVIKFDVNMEVKDRAAEAIAKISGAP